VRAIECAAKVEIQSGTNDGTLQLELLSLEKTGYSEHGCSNMQRTNGSGRYSPTR